MPSAENMSRARKGDRRKKNTIENKTREKRVENTRFEME